ncbi:unnamed protein product [Arabis nemorensis]|uniref:F-box protein n=1 Tax=Arabis nemorensis TaxID=586526 RepID=A0A565CHC4_9BRAS|nr:unnamed protein product [Arabis nemorensis]
MHKEDDTEPLPPPPSWQILCLVGPYMDPETLAVASCVSTTWSNCFSSEDIWRSFLIVRSSQGSCASEIALKFGEGASYKGIIITVESNAKRRRKNLPKPKISLSDLIFIVNVSTKTKSAMVYEKGKDLVFGSNEDKFEIELDVSNTGINSGEKDVKMTWQVVYGFWEKFFIMVDTTRPLHRKYGWFTDYLDAKDDSRLVGEMKTSFNGQVLEKIGFSIVNTNDRRNLTVNDVLRYVERFCGIA